ncbi:hypothetical protein SESBI_14716 [Sesbania bispinosa]|nr:hypothetical protein SESBI_14716 [Sesbania bispinosa]
MGAPYPSPITPTKTRVGWIGIGVMGGAMASRLLNAGYSLTIYARNPSNPDCVTVDMTSSHPDLAREIFAVARSRGCWSVDAPVSGGDIGARDGKLAIFAAGECAVVKWLALMSSSFWGAVKGGAAGSNAMELFGERMIQRNWGGGFVGYMVKDLGMGVDVVEKGEDDKVVVLPGASLSKQLFSSMVAIGNGLHGPQGLITVIERINGKRPL